MAKTKEKFDFDDINLIPKKCIVNSRSECDTSIKFGKFTFQMPVVPANMECIINEDLCVKLAQSGYFYIMHRFGVNLEDFIIKMKSLNLFSSISVGVNEDSYVALGNLIEKGLSPDFITIDIAHGHSIKMERMMKFLKSSFKDSFVIAGNISSPRAVRDLEDWGADALKVGIASGSVCTTWPSTGFGSRNCQASTIFICSSPTSLPIIADGGIKNPGDISKSLAMGAKMVMIGGMLSGFNDSPGDVVQLGELTKKEFWGSASASQSNKVSRIEGKKVLVDYKDRSILDEMAYLKECLQSSISYAGGKDLECLGSVSWI